MRWIHIENPQSLEYRVFVFNYVAEAFARSNDSPPSLILRSPYLSSATRADISILSQLRTDFSALNAHRYRRRLAPSLACDACGAVKEAVARSTTPVHCLDPSCHDLNTVPVNQGDPYSDAPHEKL